GSITLIFGLLLFGLGFAAAVIMGILVREDADRRGMNNGVLWGVGAASLGIVFLPLFMLVRKRPSGAVTPRISPSQHSDPDYRPIRPRHCYNCGGGIPLEGRFCPSC